MSRKACFNKRTVGERCTSQTYSTQQIDRTFSFTFLSTPFSLGHERVRRGVESQVSICFVGGNPVLFRA
jgi:hypothetical protein